MKIIEVKLYAVKSGDAKPGFGVGLKRELLAPFRS